MLLEDLINKNFSLKLFQILKKYENFIKQPFTSHFINNLNDLSEIDRKILLKRVQGDAIASIGNIADFSKQRISQMLSSICERLMNSAEIVAHTIMLGSGKYYLNYSELKIVLISSIDTDCCWYVLKQSGKFNHLSFTDILVAKSYSIEKIEKKLYILTYELYGDYFNVQDKFKFIESRLNDDGITYLDYQDVKNYMLKIGYNFYGEFAAKGRQPLDKIYSDAIIKYFDFDLNLNKSSEDLKLFRKIIDEHYNGLTLPNSDAALVGRLQELLVLSDRRRYCPIEKAVYSKSLMSEIFSYIQKSDEIYFYYSELYNKFEKKLLLETNITNYHFLHGVLKYLYSDDFNFKRDYLIMKGFVFPSKTYW